TPITSISGRDVQSSAAVATRREGRQSQRSNPAVRHRRWGRDRLRRNAEINVVLKPCQKATTFAEAVFRWERLPPEVLILNLRNENMRDPDLGGWCVVLGSSEWPHRAERVITTRDDPTCGQRR